MTNNPIPLPSTAIQCEFGVNDLVLDILVEKVVLAVETLKYGEDRISKRILSAMLQKQIPGFCTEVLEACDILGVSIDNLTRIKSRVAEPISSISFNLIER